LNPAQEQLSERNTGLNFFKSFSGVGSRAKRPPNRNVDARSRGQRFTVVRERMVLRNTGDGLELRVSRHVTTSNSMPLALALCRASKSRAARSTSRAVGAYLHQQSMPWASVRAFSSTLSSRRVPVRTVRCRARSVTKGAALLGGWRQLTLLGMHACSCKCALERLPIRTVRHTVASHDMQHIDLCEADSMLADNVALELLLPQHEA